MGRQLFTPALIGCTSDTIVVVMTDVPIDGIIVLREGTFYSVSRLDGVNLLTVRLFVGPDGSALRKVPVNKLHGSCDQSLTRHVLQTQEGSLAAQFDDSGTGMFWCGEEVYLLQGEHQIVVNDDGVPQVLVPVS